MKKRILPALLGTAFLAGAVGVEAANDPEQDRAKMVQQFKSMFPDVAFEDFSYGAYALDADLKAQHDEVTMDFHPAEDNLTHGQELWEASFANGKTYASCFPNGGEGVAAGYPYYDEKLKTVVNLPMALNMCREKNGEKALPWGKPEIVDLEIYFKSLSNGMPINVSLDSPGAKEKYEAGRDFFFSRRGQLNFSCAQCHLTVAGKKVRADLLSPALGHPSHFPTYRVKWGKPGTLHQRYRGCNRNIRAEPLAFQSEEYKNLELFETYLSNGIPIEVPGYRK